MCEFVVNNNKYIFLYGSNKLNCIRGQSISSIHQQISNRKTEKWLTCIWKWYYRFRILLVPNWCVEGQKELKNGYVYLNVWNLSSIRIDDSYWQFRIMHPVGNSSCTGFFTQTFDGNDNKWLRVNWFPVPIVTRYIRVIAVTWTPTGSGPCLRIDLYGCAHGMMGFFCPPTCSGSRGFQSFIYFRSGCDHSLSSVPPE